MSGQRIVVATSFPPRLRRNNVGTAVPDYDRHCVQSWLACGFRVLGINAEDEIPALSKRHPEVEFIATTRDGRAEFGRAVPYITDILSILLRVDAAAVLSIINSDLIFQPEAAWQEVVSPAAGRTVLLGRRYDLCTLMGGALYPYPAGFDYFFFGRSAAAELVGEQFSFAMGSPWWDYWLPVMLGMRGYTLRPSAWPLVLHLLHEERAAEALSGPWRKLAMQYAASIAGQAGKPGVAGAWRELTEFCTSLVARKEVTAALDRDIVRLIPLTVRCLWPANVSFPQEDSIRPLTEILPREWFDSARARIAAGRFVREAEQLEQGKMYAEAAALDQQAAAGASRDAGVLSMLGNCLLSQGDGDGAVVCLRRAAENAPDSAYVLNSLGSALLQLNRPGEAAVCFDRAITAEPLNGLNYYRLAQSLLPQQRHREAIDRLERQIAGRPEFPDGPRWLEQIRTQLGV